MKNVLKVLFVMAFFAVLMNAAMADEVGSLVWQTRGGVLTVESINALDGGSPYETEPSKVTSIQMLDFGKNSVLCINCGKLEGTEQFPTVTCQGMCTIYTGFSEAGDTWMTDEPIPPAVQYYIADSSKYKPNQPISEKAADSEEETGKLFRVEDVKAGGWVLDRKGQKLYTVSKDNIHAFRLNGAKVTFNNAMTKAKAETMLREIKGLTPDEIKNAEEMIQNFEDPENHGRVELIESVSKGLRTAWGDGLGMPVKKGDIVVPQYASKDVALSMIVGGKEKASDWLDELPDELKDKDGERSEISLCGYKFTNYYAGSTFTVKKSKDEKSCEMEKYKLKTALFVAEDAVLKTIQSTFKEYPYKCGVMSFQAVGGNVNGLSCLLSEYGSELHCMKENGCNEDQQVFRMQLGDKPSYWVSINKNAKFSTAVKLSRKPIVFWAMELSVSQHIEGTGGAKRYQGDRISFNEANPVIFVMPEDELYKNIPGFTDLPQIQLLSEDGLMITRSIVKPEHNYIFEAPHTDYVLQLGEDINRAMFPISVIVPKDYEFKPKGDEIKNPYVGKGIEIVGASTKEGISLRTVSRKIFIQHGQETKNLAGITDKKLPAKETMPLADLVARHCGYTQFYAFLDENARKKLEPIIKAVKEDERNKDFITEDDKIAKDTKELYFPQEKVVYERNGREITVTLTDKGCPRAISEAILTPKRDYCIQQDSAVYKPAVCVTTKECKAPIAETTKNNALEQGEFKECKPGTVCCSEGNVITGEKKANLPPKKGRIRDDTPCTKGLNGVCGDERTFNCIDINGNPQAFVKGKCLKYPFALDYKCCAGTLEQKSREEMLQAEEGLLWPLVSTACSQVCSEILGKDAKQKCTKAGSDMKAAQCDTACQFITGMGCTKIRKCAAGSAAGCKYTLDEVDGKTCEIPPDSKDNKCILVSV